MRTTAALHLGIHLMHNTFWDPPRPLLVPACFLHAFQEERHLECSAIEPVRARNPTLFSPVWDTMLLFMRCMTLGRGGGASHHGVFCLLTLNMHQPHCHQPCRLLQ